MSGIVADQPGEVEYGSVDGVLTVSERAGFPEAVALAVEHARQCWDDLDEWVWALTDDRVPEPGCLAALLRAAEAVPSIAALRPFAGADQSIDDDDAPGADLLTVGALLPVSRWETSAPPDGPVLCGLQACLRPVGAEAQRSERSRSGTPGLFARATRARWFPPTVLAAALTVVALVLNIGRLGLDLAGGALLPVGDLGQVWAEYLAAWHGVAGGTASGSPAALAVLGVLGAPLAPIGGPAAAVAVLLIGDLPLAALSAYAAARWLRPRTDRWIGAGIAAAYALLPPATAATVQGRVDVVAVHTLLPVVLVAAVAAVRGPVRARWLSASVLSALGTAVSAAFVPMTYPLLVAVLIAGFLSAPAGRGRLAGIGSLAVTVLLPPALLLPWLPTLVARPSLLVHGLGGPVATDPGLGALLGLQPGGPGGSIAGLVVVVAAVVAVVFRPSKRLLPAGGVLLLGVSAVAASLVEVAPVQGGAPAPGFTGVALLFVGAGLLTAVLTAVDTGPPGWTGRCARLHPAARPRLATTTAVAAVAALVALVAGVVLTGRDGPLHRSQHLLTPAQEAELADTGRGVVVLAESPDRPPRLAAGRTPRFGDDALAPVGPAATRLADWQRDLLVAGPEAVSSLAEAAAAGVLFVVLPEGEDGSRLVRQAGELVEVADTGAGGRSVLRLTAGPATAGPVTLTSSDQARRSVSEQPPATELMAPPASVSVGAVPPEVGVRVSEGSEGRLLVLPAAYEPGWRATVDGAASPIVLAWGGQVAVAVPPRSSEVRVSFDSSRHELLLLGQVAAVLGTVLTAVPSLRGPRALSRRR